MHYALDAGTTVEDMILRCCGCSRRDSNKLQPYFCIFSVHFTLTFFVVNFYKKLECSSHFNFLERVFFWCETNTKITNLPLNFTLGTEESVTFFILRVRSVNWKSSIFCDEPSDFSLFTIFEKTPFGKKVPAPYIDDCSIFFNSSLKSVESF